MPFPARCGRERHIRDPALALGLVLVLGLVLASRWRLACTTGHSGRPCAW